jgi:hypothetical protein
MLVTAAWFGPVLVGSRDGVTWLLFLGLPGACGATAGALFGRPLATPAGLQDDRGAVVRGVAIAAAAFLLYAPLFAWVLGWSEPGWTNVLGLTALVAAFGILAVGWVLAGTGGLVGWLLNRWARRTCSGEKPAAARPGTPI